MTKSYETGKRITAGLRSAARSVAAFATGLRDGLRNQETPPLVTAPPSKPVARKRVARG